MRRDAIEISECEAVRRALLDDGELTENQLEHAETCAVCADAVMETEIEAALEMKPGVVVPTNFAARVATQARGENGVRRWVRQGVRNGLPRHVGLGVAVGLLLVLLAVVTMSDPRWLTATGTVRVGLMLVLAGEVAGLALWLGMRREM